MFHIYFSRFQLLSEPVQRFLLLHNGFLHPPVLCLHLLHTLVANSSLRENEEPLIGFEGISSGIDRGGEGIGYQTPVPTQL